mmetsp:Transcript_10172/g.41392  ORF Transcript_10172/g.41392 Transcript_10172/m.41392 type:complete len:219 (-) Transcript_10172:1337-1993(-)
MRLLGVRQQRQLERVPLRHAVQPAQAVPGDVAEPAHASPLHRHQQGGYAAAGGRRERLHLRLRHRHLRADALARPLRPRASTLLRQAGQYGGQHWKGPQLAAVEPPVHRHAAAILHLQQCHRPRIHFLQPLRRLLPGQRKRMPQYLQALHTGTSTVTAAGQRSCMRGLAPVGQHLPGGHGGRARPSAAPEARQVAGCANAAGRQQLMYIRVFYAFVRA